MQIKGLRALPLVLTSRITGKSIPVLMSEITGLSLSRLRKSDLRALRPTTEQQAVSRAYQAKVKQWISLRWDKEEAENWVKNLPPTTVEADTSMTQWVYSFSTPNGDNYLPNAIDMAGRIDRLLGAAETAMQGQDLAALNDAFGELDCFRSALPFDDWEDLDRRWPKTLDAVMLLLFAAIDVDFCFTYFQGHFQAQPLMSYLFPEEQPHRALTGSRGTCRRKCVHRPIRKLLEFVHALAYYRKRGKWPSSPASRAEIALMTGYLATDLGNFYDGSKKLRTSAFCEIWWSLTPARDVAVPFPMYMVAAYFQMIFEFTQIADFSPYIERYEEAWEFCKNSATPPLDFGEAAWPPWMIREGAIWLSSADKPGPND